MVRLLIVDDSKVFRKLLRKRLAAFPDIEVVGEANDPYEAREAIARLRPDALTLDLEMPRMDGVQLLRKLMKHYPLPVVVVSSFTHDNSPRAIEAFAAGAVEVIGKPTHRSEIEATMPLLVRAIRAAAASRPRAAAAPATRRSTRPVPVEGSASAPASTARRTTNRVAVVGSSGQPEARRGANRGPVVDPRAGSTPSSRRSTGRVPAVNSNAPASRASTGRPPADDSRSPGAVRRNSRPVRVVGGKEGPARLIAIGASTGGPMATETVLRGLPADCPPVVVAQHMPKQFTGSFARRLDSTCTIEVREAQEGDVLEAGVALVAPGDFHMTVRKRGDRLIVALDRGEKVHHQRPAVDRLFRSVADVIGGRAIGVILTGMGADGAAGLFAMRQRGCLTLSQHESDCVVYGMPKAAVEAGAVENVVRLDDMARTVMSALGPPVRVAG